MPRDGFRIRFCDQESDAACLAALGATTFIDTFSHLYEPDELQKYLETSHSYGAAKQFLTSPDFGVWLCEDRDDRAVGYCMAGKNKLPASNACAHAGELSRLYCLRDYQNMGIGSALLTQALAWLVARFDEVYLGVYQDNPSALRLYLRFGFEIVGEYEFYVGKHADQEYILQYANQSGTNFAI